MMDDNNYNIVRVECSGPRPAPPTAPAACLFFERAVNEVLMSLHLVFMEIEPNRFLTRREISLLIVTNNGAGKM